MKRMQLDRPLDRPINAWTLWALPLGLSVLIMLAFSACTQSSGISTGGPVVDTSLPPEVTITKELMDTAPLATVERANPFLSLLATEEKEAEVVEAAPVFDDPYEGLSLGGIVYNKKRSLAIVSMGDKNNKIMRLGDVFMAPGDTSIVLKVSAISKDVLTLTVSNPPDKYPAELRSRSLFLPSLVGFRGKDKASASGTSASGNSSSGSDTGTISPETFGKLPKELQALLGGKAN